MVMRTQNELKELYKEHLELAWADSKMVDYCSKKAEIVIETEDGYLLEIEKQSIKKNFCFGYGMYLNSTPEEEEMADNNAEYARTNADYFVRENLKWYDTWIKELKENGAYVSKIGHYTGQDKNCKLQFFTSGKGSWGRTPADDPETYKKLSAEDTNNLLNAFNTARENMIKRLNTYLKKYGLSKLNIWTYLRD